MDYLKILKFVIGATISILIAGYFDLPNAFSAGLLTIMSITDTKKSTLKLATQRLISLILGICIGLICFKLIGYTLFSFIIILIVYIPLSMKLNLMGGLLPSLVLLSQLMLSKDTSILNIWNEVSLMLVAITVGSILNLYIPSLEDNIFKIKQDIEKNIQKIYYIFYLKLIPKSNRDILEEKIPKEDLEHLLVNLKDNISKLNKLVLVEEENSFFKNNEYDRMYASMRYKQSNILFYMYESLKLLKLDRKPGIELASLFYLTAEQVEEMNSCEYILDDIELLLNRYRVSGLLPKNREEFEDRAVLYMLITDFKRFIDLKYNFVKKYIK